MLLLPRCGSPRAAYGLQRHFADGAGSGLRLDNLRMHGAGERTEPVSPATPRTGYSPDASPFSGDVL
jgi:hypothetical protein